MWSLKTSGMEALAGYWALENPVADRLKPRLRVHLDLLAIRAIRGGGWFFLPRIPPIFTNYCLRMKLML